MYRIVSLNCLDETNDLSGCAAVILVAVYHQAYTQNYQRVTIYYVICLYVPFMYPYENVWCDEKLVFLLWRYNCNLDTLLDS